MIHFVLTTLTLLGTLAHARDLEPSVAANIPHLTLTTEDGVAPGRDGFVNGRIEIDPRGGDATFASSAPMAIIGRGNSTWGMPKKPYRIKLDAVASLLGLPADRDWILLANFADKTLLRTLVAGFLGTHLDMDYTPRMRTVTVTLNDAELGAYILTEEIKITPDRVPAPADDVTGGYLLEVDQRRGGENNFETTRSEPLSIQRPSAPTTEQRDYIKTYVQKFEDALFSPDFTDSERGYAAYIDVDSFVSWYLVNEILKNQDAGNFSSIYFHKGSGGKLMMGPLWDFDLAAGNVDYTDARNPEGWWVRWGSPWFERLFEDPAFDAKVIARFDQLRAASTDFDAITGFIDRTARELDVVQRKNFEIWDILGTYVWPNPVVTGSYHGEVDYLKSWLTVRLRWMQAQYHLHR